MTTDLFDTLLQETRQAYTGHAAMMEFAPFPDVIEPQPITPHHCPCADVFLQDTALASDTYTDLHAAIAAAAPAAHWRETYKDTDIGDDFMDRFGCYCIIGDGGPFASDRIRLYMVYMPPHLYYPWHHHPAEEIYLVVAGQAQFRRDGTPDAHLTEGQTSFHASNQPHAMQTASDPVLCLVAWRNRFDTPPVLTDRKA